MTDPVKGGPGERRRSFPPRSLTSSRDRKVPPRESPAVPPGPSRSTGESDGHSFEAVEALLPNLFPPGTDPTRIWLPPVPKPQSPGGDEAHLLRYWQVHVWKTLLRYRRAYADPACTDRLRSGYPAVEEAAVRLAGRVASGGALNPMDSVGCHSILRELEAGAAALESTITALSADSDPSRPEPTSLPKVAAVAIPPVSPVADAVPAGPMAPDVFVTSSPPRWRGFRFGRHGSATSRRDDAAPVGTSPVGPGGTRGATGPTDRH